MVILGSGSIVSQLAQEGLIDEFQIVVNPHRAGQGEDDVRRRQEKIAAEADKDADLRATAMSCCATSRRRDG